MQAKTCCGRIGLEISQDDCFFDIKFVNSHYIGVRYSFQCIASVNKHIRFLLKVAASASLDKKKYVLTSTESVQAKEMP